MSKSKGANNPFGIGYSSREMRRRLAKGKGAGMTSSPGVTGGRQATKLVRPSDFKVKS